MILVMFFMYIEIRTTKCPPVVGCPGGIFAKREWKEIVLSKWTVKVNRCDDCSKL
jgi:hypothetical protein